MERYLFEGNISVKAALLANRRRVYEILAEEEKKDRDTMWILHQAQARGVAVRRIKREAINQIAQGRTHGGIVAWCGKRQLQSFPPKEEQDKPCFLAFVEGIEDPFNFGAILRTLYAGGCDGVLLPKRNWSEAAGLICRSSAGASEYIPLISAPNAQEMQNELKQRNIPLLCAERKNAVSLYEYRFPKRLCLAIGGEMRGLSRDVREASAQNLFIPYGREVRNALNAVSATAVFAFEILRQKQGG